MVVTGRVTDASVIVGPAAFHHGWTPEQYDELAGAVVAGHVIECGTHATGGNFSGFTSIDPALRAKPLGFPLAEIAADGSFVVTKHEGTGGAVTVDTVTAQLVYEIQSAKYLNPDVTTLLDTVELTQEGPDRVAVSGVRGEAPPATLKVCVNELGGWRNSMEILLTGLEIDAKEEWVKEQMVSGLGRQGPGDRRLVPLRPAGRGPGRPGARLVRAPGDGAGRRPQGRRQGLHRPRGRGRAGLLPGADPDGPARTGDAVRRSTARSTSTARPSSTPSCTPTAPARWSPTRRRT